MIPPSSAMVEIVMPPPANTAEPGAVHIKDAGKVTGIIIEQGFIDRAFVWQTQHNPIASAHARHVHR